MRAQGRHKMHVLKRHKMHVDNFEHNPATVTRCTRNVRATTRNSLVQKQDKTHEMGASQDARG